MERLHAMVAEIMGESHQEVAPDHEMNKQSEESRIFFPVLHQCFQT
jgi:hypothetical protein